MNRLQEESSPYLQQHAGNPVDWFAWKPEALAKARREDKPILVSIGYSTCHWCHVMERESFENEEVAAFMNEHFVNIKVDREERPDIDHIYMEACQAMTGSGGWPLNCFLLPDGRPFYAGTYFPPRPAHNRASWMQVLQRIHRAFRDRRSEIEKQAQALSEAIGRAERLFLGRDPATTDREEPMSSTLLDEVFQKMRSSFDKVEGGFGGAPKFPSTMSLQFLLEYGHLTEEADAIKHVHLSLEKMIHGGIYDQIGGGFARYATDRAWLVPHFEKMLYDNALLVEILADAHRQSGRDLYKKTIDQTMSFVEREMSSPEGGFYSALDADSEGEEGKFYVWDRSEVEEVLGEEAELVCDFFDISEAGNWEGKNILWRPRSLEQFAAERDLDPHQLERRITSASKRLLARRAERIRPGLDDKIILGWNALMNSACSKACAATGNTGYLELARKNLDFLLDAFARQEGGLNHTYKDGEARYPAFLDDYAFTIKALLDFCEIRTDTRYLGKAADLSAYLMENFLDEETDLFYFTSSSQKDLPMRKKELYDSATPSGNSTMAVNLMRLGILLNEEAFRLKSRRMLEQMAEAVGKYPTSFARWASGILYQVHPTREIAIVGEAAEDKAAEVNALYIP
ncbi:MAG: thioredoxin domain-containing protein, partial [Saprospiraceae bacterium]|nr:thioredoxin domain-containing protein [Saprospiraceae bacterium]